MVFPICDTGPLVAYLNRRDPHHAWAHTLMNQVSPPRLTSEPVLTEAVHFLQDRLDVEPLFQLLERGALDVAFDVSAHWSRVRTLMTRYARMELADASIVVMGELHPRCQVLTVDRKDFTVYRRHDRQVISFIAPPQG